MSRDTGSAMTPDLIKLHMILSAEHVTSLRQMAEQFGNDPSLSPYMQDLWLTVKRQIDNNVTRDQTTAGLLV